MCFGRAFLHSCKVVEGGVVRGGEPTRCAGRGHACVALWGRLGNRPRDAGLGGREDFGSPEWL